MQTQAPVVLCLDNDPNALFLTMRSLEAAGYSVLTAADGPTALAKVASGAVDAVVFDHGLAGITGEQLAVEISRVQPHVPKLFFTARRTVSSGAGRFIEAFCSKTNGPRALLELLANLLGLKQADDGAVSLHAHIAIARLGIDWAAPQEHMSLPDRPRTSKGKHRPRVAPQAVMASAAAAR